MIQTEHARVNVAKGKLESLCRELQRHSKAVAVSKHLHTTDTCMRRYCNVGVNKDVLRCMVILCIMLGSRLYLDWCMVYTDNVV